ncbi:unnamed protein product [Soboliphyme baturini]|uniref:Secreted protein n=1 Tax=Soboliphyme baturini TaxID=241478 RepID=A0A183IS16_9BILA|nr:unnamed protein product [Soboliphyme baturini]
MIFHLCGSSFFSYFLLLAVFDSSDFQVASSWLRYLPAGLRLLGRHRQLVVVLRRSQLQRKRKKNLRRKL